MLRVTISIGVLVIRITLLKLRYGYISVFTCVCVYVLFVVVTTVRIAECPITGRCAIANNSKEVLGVASFQNPITHYFSYTGVSESVRIYNHLRLASICGQISKL